MFVIGNVYKHFMADLSTIDQCIPPGTAFGVLLSSITHITKHFNSQNHRTDLMGLAILSYKISSRIVSYV